MHGLGDNIHERALIRQLIDAGKTVYLETSWPSVFHDFTASGRLFFLRKTTRLRTQEKNSTREANRFARVAPTPATSIRVWYPPLAVRRNGSVLRAMLAEAGANPDKTDFRLPVPAEWAQRLPALKRDGRPLMIYRPLVERVEWDCKARNPDVTAYRYILDAIRDQFFVVSIADLVPGKEWLVDKRPFRADAEFHRGELTFEMLAALTRAASLVYCSPGFMVPLSQAVGTPAVVVFGGYERAYSFSAGAAFTPFCGIEPVTPCDCFSHSHRCEKRIDVDAAMQRIKLFVDEFITTTESEDDARFNLDQGSGRETPGISPAIL